MTAKIRLAEIETALLGRELVYFGTRGADAESLLNLPNLASIFALIAPLDARSVHEISLEGETGERVELDCYSLDSDRRKLIDDLRRRLLHLFDRPSAVLPYRPCSFLTSAWFPRSDRTLYLGMFHNSQACFEHKPWVESQLSRFGVRVIPWCYWADSDRRLISEWATKQILVLRTNYSDGGAGVRLLRDPSAIDTEWPTHGDGFLAAAPYLESSIPLNINACVFPDGTLTLHGPSLQVIGIPSLTRRVFGYCGNDFARVADLETHVLDELEKMTVRTGSWLHQNGYRGAFGIDALLHDGLLYLTEVNPRFQGSSLHSARIDDILGRADIFLEHAAAFLGLSASSVVPLRELARAQPAISHLIFHNPHDVPIRVKQQPIAGPEVSSRLLPGPDVLVLQGAIAFELVVSGSVTTDGTSLMPETRTIVDAELVRLCPATTSNLPPHMAHTGRRM